MPYTDKFRKKYYPWWCTKFIHVKLFTRSNKSQSSALRSVQNHESDSYDEKFRCPMLFFDVFDNEKCSFKLAEFDSLNEYFRLLLIHRMIISDN